MRNSFLSNYSETSFVDKIKDSLMHCSAFCFSVSFIKKAGLVLIEKEIEQALDRGVKGRIITSTYQNFTDVLSLNKFLEWQYKYKNFECHLDLQCFGNNGFHSKGYYFEYKDSYELIIGSSNITRFALLKNIEWNMSLTSIDNIDAIKDAYEEFVYLWDRTFLLSDELINKYKVLQTYAIEKWDMDYIDSSLDSVKPNYMQRKALKELRRYRDTGVKKALIIAAMGVGKTYLAAFDARNCDAKRVLFIVHRDAILFNAKETFMKVFGAERSYGFYTGKSKSLDCDFIFATNTMVSSHLSEFMQDEFDYIVLDECHHASASTYQKIIKYFTPDFLLGLTATPERMDNQDIFGLFEQNVPYELRLREAILNNLVVPFKYYGIKDQFADYSSLDKAIVAREIAKSSNVEFIASQIELHRPQNGKLKALAFCTNIAHCNLMAEELMQNGYNAISLTGNDNLGNRIKAFNSLQDEKDDLEIICTVDILNEGVDIPSVNMVLFLRPTESQTVFLQQLGRGLRKYPNKEYVTILDFIGNNYDRSVQIALALGTLGKTTYTEKSYLRDLVSTNYASLGIPGVEIFFDDLSKIEIINYINNQNFNRKDFLKKDYENFKKYLKKDTYPSHMDYLNSEISPDLIKFIKCTMNGTTNKSYYSFMRKIEEENIPYFTDKQQMFLDNISEFLPLIRPEEYLIIRQMLHSELNLDELLSYSSRITHNSLVNALKILEKKQVLINNALNVDSLDSEFLIYMNDLLEYGLTRCQQEFGEFEGKFKVLGNYYKEQIQMARLKTSLMSIKGTDFDESTGEVFCYVGLQKDASISERLKYKDKFLDDSTFQWESETNTTLTNSIGKKLLNSKTVHLFVRKMKSENGVTLPFTYFGKGHFTNCRVSYTENGGTKSPTLLFDIILDHKVPSEYFLDFNIEEVRKDII